MKPNRTMRIIPKDKIEGMRFGQLLVNVLAKNGHMSWQTDGKGGLKYEVTGRDLFYLENDDLEKMIQDYLGSEIKR